MEMITEQMLKTLVPKSDIRGVILVKGYNVSLTKQGKEYIVGSLQSGVDIPFKAWGDSRAFTELKGANYENIPSYITATVDDYGGAVSLVVNTVQAVEGFTADQFFPIKYDIDAYWGALRTISEKLISEKGFTFCDSILFSNTELAERFKVEFAAKSIHDNCKGGLLAHTYKVLSLMQSVLKVYSSLTMRNGAVDTDLCDLFYIGALLHDIGKTMELNFGIYQPTSIVTHRYLGLEMLEPYKDAMIKAYGEDWWYRLVSVMLQHHGEFDDPCRTVVAYAVHLVDYFDTQVTALQQAVDLVGNEMDKQIKVVDKGYLTI